MSGFGFLEPREESQHGGIAEVGWMRGQGAARNEHPLYGTQASTIAAYVIA